VAPTTQDGLVDVDMIPQMLLKRVDTVTGGVSAVYGSDAISGVVNFITDTKFEGVKVNLQSGLSQRSDDNTWDGGVASAPSCSGIAAISRQATSSVRSGHSEQTGARLGQTRVDRAGRRHYGEPVPSR